jgi:hypothetical protein
MKKKVKRKRKYPNSNFLSEMETGAKHLHPLCALLAVGYFIRGNSTNV